VHAVTAGTRCYTDAGFARTGLGGAARSRAVKFEPFRVAGRFTIVERAETRQGASEVFAAVKQQQPGEQVAAASANAATKA
jgi:hypothetical protein